MVWLVRYRLRHYLADAVWVLPSLGIVAALVAAPALAAVFRPNASMVDENALAVLATLASSMFTFIVFVSSALLLAVQLASAQLTPRIIAFLFRDPSMKWSLTLFTFTYTFTLAVLVRASAGVPLGLARIAGYGSLLSLVVFLYLIDHVGKSFRPGGALRLIGLAGRGVIEEVYPARRDRHVPAERVAEIRAPGATRTVASAGDGMLLAADVRGLVALARRERCVVELVPQVGAFVALGDTLFRVYGEARGLSETELCRSVALGHERTQEQDPKFALRIIVDVGCKALSHAINDPTTAVLAVDQLYHLLRSVGQKDLDDGVVTDAAGEVRLILARPNWGDFVRLAVTEIRLFGGESIQVARRLRAMLEGLIATLPEDRTPLLRQELQLLQRGAERLFADPEDRAMASVSDVQGVGGTGDAERG